MADPPAAPDWVSDLVIYELNPRTFTSPHGPGADGHGSGTFASLAERLPYLADLGVNAIWMAGHARSTDHFYGIWSAYAADRPDLVDPALGPAGDLRALVAAAHAHGIRVLLDVIAHGVVTGSALVREHPQWFHGGSWGMADFDYTDPGFRQWWVELWTGYVRDYDVDGFRVDVSLVDPTVWDEITARCAALGKPIAVIPENGRYHLGQQEVHGPALDPVLDWAVAREFHGNRLTLRQLSCHDRGWEALPGNHYVARGSRAKLGYGLLLNPQVPLFFAGEEFDAEPVALPRLRQGLFGTGGPGGWLYGCRLDWSQLDDPSRRAVLDDTRRFLAARRRYRHLITADPAAGEMVRAAGNGASALVPWLRYRPGEDAVLVVGNDLPRPVEFVLSLPLDQLGFAGAETVWVTDILADATPCAMTPAELTDLRVDVGADYTPGGGVRAFHLSLLEPSGEPR
ncbi:alpha-amylase family glycosyl hydrolase [Dactylosporangium sp. AC04546]|uniref:alpha-amylase family glycosyl hydrolase n=1 Tax=Dactylosporangium sp. AC04546 TaxID=2862460 RepID=UPI0021072CE1|nr:alpha-amylase family glycosyl hydrolase [Dactylosporangium sp. AC04546]WVK89744.1 alpha-amylase family glycosyl hydrolase [Dactylosporangium sp. AC04546]